jgi:hypothetical protein
MADVTGHGRALPVGGDRRAAAGAGGAGAARRARRGGGEADRARAALLSLDGRSGAAIGRAPRARADTARAWRSSFARGGARAPRARPRPGRPGRRAGGGRLGPCRGDPGRARRGGLDAAAAGGGDHAAGRRRRLALAPQPAAAPKGGFAWRRPRHTLKGRQDRDAVERVGLRLRPLRQQAAAGDVRLLFGDGSRRRSRTPTWRTPGRGAGQTCGSRRPGGRGDAPCWASSTTPPAGPPS